MALIDMTVVRCGAPARPGPAHTRQAAPALSDFGMSAGYRKAAGTPGRRQPEQRPVGPFRGAGHLRHWLPFTIIANCDYSQIMVNQRLLIGASLGLLGSSCNLLVSGAVSHVIQPRRSSVCEHSSRAVRCVALQECAEV